MSKVTDAIALLGAAVIEGLISLGRFVIFLLSSALYIFEPPYKPRLAIRQIRIIGAESLFLVVLIAAFTGMVLGLQGYVTLSKFGSESALGTVVALTLVRELGPVLAALMVTARAGSAQIDAMTVMAVNPVQYLVSPRLLAGVISFPLLTAIFDVVGILGGYLIGVGLMHGPSASYFNGIQDNLGAHDIMSGFYKSLVFGLVITWVCCYKGYHAARMSVGIGRATTEAVVLSSVLVLVWDYFLTSILL
jgi:phospholipid/cholesterol/gamma-HCH transport system permease protein